MKRAYGVFDQMFNGNFAGEFSVGVASHVFEQPMPRIELEELLLLEFRLRCARVARHVARARTEHRVAQAVDLREKAQARCARRAGSSSGVAFAASSEAARMVCSRLSRNARM